MKRIILLGVIVVVLLIVGLGEWSPWHRQTTVFYEPLILPLEVLEGDIIVLQNGSHYFVDEDKRINAITYGKDSFTINATVHRSLWDILDIY